MSCSTTCGFSSFSYRRANRNLVQGWTGIAGGEMAYEGAGLRRVHPHVDHFTTCGLYIYFSLGEEGLSRSSTQEENAILRQKPQLAHKCAT